MYFSINDVPNLLKGKVYDCIFSLGGSCATASQIKLRGLRKESLPFDWVYHTTPKSLIKITQCFQENFVNWLKKENLYQFEKSDIAKNELHYEDKYTGYRFIHDFKYSLDEEYPLVKEKYDRRLKRLFCRLSEAKNVLIILNVAYHVEIQDIAPLKKILLMKYPNQHFEFVVINLASDKEEIIGMDDIYVIRTKRSENPYDYSTKTFEYSFLDNIDAKVRLSIKNRIYYQIYRNFKKKLHRNGIM